MEEETDAQLVARARADDTDAFRSLLERYQPMAFHLALRMVGEEMGQIFSSLIDCTTKRVLSLLDTDDDSTFFLSAHTQAAMASVA